MIELFNGTAVLSRYVQNVIAIEQSQISTLNYDGEIVGEMAAKLDTPETIDTEI